MDPLSGKAWSEKVRPLKLGPSPWIPSWERRITYLLSCLAFFAFRVEPWFTRGSEITKRDFEEIKSRAINDLAEWRSGHRLRQRNRRSWGFESHRGVRFLGFHALQCNAVLWNLTCILMLVLEKIKFKKIFFKRKWQLKRSQFFIHQVNIDRLRMANKFIVQQQKYSF
jgi:hypothetical protein